MIKSGTPLSPAAGWTEWTQFSQKGNREYRIMAAFPEAPPPAGGYPVIYALDGDAVFYTLAESARLQTRKPHGYDPVVIVGIGYPSREPFDMERRCFDFTMPADKKDLPQRPGGINWPDNGGADLFLDFVESELAPQIGKHALIHPGRQAIFGHSLGGLLVLHALFARPQAFRYFIAGSPSIWWNNKALLQEKKALEQAWMKRKPEGPLPRLLITLGEEELGHMISDAEELVQDLESLAPFGFSSELVIFPGESHVSVLPAALSRTIGFALKPDTRE